MKTSSRNNPPRIKGVFEARVFISSGLTVLTGSLLLLLFVQWSHYLSYIRADDHWTTVDRFILGLILYSKTLWLFLPLLFLLGFCLLFRWYHGLIFFGFILTMVPLSWLIIDIWVRERFGGALEAYLPFALDAIRANSITGHLKWAGDFETVCKELIVKVGQVLFILTVLFLAIFLAVRRWSRIEHHAVTRGMFVRVSLIYLAIAVICLPAGMFSPHLRDITYAVAASPGPALDRWSLSIRDFVGQSADQENVTITSLVPDPYGHDNGKEEVTFFNNSSSPRSLKGFSLVNTTGKRYIFSDTWISPSQMKTVTLKPTDFRLRNGGDQLRFYDSSEQLIESVSYTKPQVRRGAVLELQRSGESHYQMRLLSNRIQATYEELFPRIQEAPALDDSFALRGQRRPHVVLLILESFRFDSLTTERMPGLAIKSAEGMTFARHFAGTNTSHLALFSLLYGRSPLLFDKTLDQGLGPQAAQLFRRSDYHTSFFTSGNCAQWRRMGEFLNTKFFDQVHTEGDNWEGWDKWPEGDKNILEHVQHLLNAAKDPQFVVIFLTSTHFPYAYPLDYERFTPVGDPNTLGATHGESAAPDLRNRYRNTLLFLDSLIGNFIQQLPMENVVLAITGDHGESIMDDGTLAHGNRASEVQLRVPFVVLGSQVPRRTIDVISTHSDVLPTLLHLIQGETMNLQGVYGIDLLAPNLQRESTSFVPYYWRDPLQLVLFSDEQRLLLEISLERPVVEAIGFLDEKGYVRPSTLGGNVDWRNVFEDELLRITSGDQAR